MADTTTQQSNQPATDGAEKEKYGENEMVVESNWDEVIPTFDEMNLREDLLRGIYAYGFEKPSAIQQRGIKPILLGTDTIAQAQSGTGKTATFAISSLQKVDINVRECQALILSPTRELASQTQKVIVALGDYLQRQGPRLRWWHCRPRGHPLSPGGRSHRCRYPRTFKSTI